MKEQDRIEVLKKIEAKRAEILMKIAMSEINRGVFEMILNEITVIINKYHGSGFSEELELALNVSAVGCEISSQASEAGIGLGLGIDVECNCPRCRGNL